MKIVKPSVKIISNIPEEALKNLELAGRVCYKSEDKITEDSAINFVKMLKQRGHWSPLEHFSVTVQIVCDRGISHELVRHRLASYSQESTRYVNYASDDIQFIKPIEIEEFDDTSCGNTERNFEYRMWKEACIDAENFYTSMIKAGVKPENARSVLPNCLKTEIVMTANLREWYHIFNQRCARGAHPDMRYIMKNLLRQFINSPIGALYSDLDYFLMEA